MDQVVGTTVVYRKNLRLVRNVRIRMSSGRLDNDRVRLRNREAEFLVRIRNAFVRKPDLGLDGIADTDADGEVVGDAAAP